MLITMIMVVFGFIYSNNIGYLQGIRDSKKSALPIYDYKKSPFYNRGVQSGDNIAINENYPNCIYLGQIRITNNDPNKLAQSSYAERTYYLHEGENYAVLYDPDLKTYTLVNDEWINCRIGYIQSRLDSRQYQKSPNQKLY